MEYHSRNHKFYRYLYFVIEFFLVYQAAIFGLHIAMGWEIPFHEPILSFLFISSLLWTLWMSISRLYETRYLFHYENFLRRFPLVTIGVAGCLPSARNYTIPLQKGFQERISTSRHWRRAFSVRSYPVFSAGWHTRLTLFTFIEFGWDD